MAVFARTREATRSGVHSDCKFAHCTGSMAGYGYGWLSLISILSGGCCRAGRYSGSPGTKPECFEGTEFHRFFALLCFHHVSAFHAADSHPPYHTRNKR